MQSRGQLLHFFFTHISFCVKCEECRPNQCIKHWQVLAWWWRFPENSSMYSRLGVLPANLFLTPADPPQQQRDHSLAFQTNLEENSLRFSCRTCDKGKSLYVVESNKGMVCFLPPNIPRTHRNPPTNTKPKQESTDDVFFRMGVMHPQTKDMMIWGVMVNW